MWLLLATAHAVDLGEVAKSDGPRGAWEAARESVIGLAREACAQRVDAAAF